ncbi:hypothetical protein [Phenylobacterium deserti]|uniref:Uncharacterized protein n=1 Tax=Phenylobacterium deserti TaxID=1914756 RepID=A0A328ACB3_9CAUL|nr:hypothetical protein [Phenylobacterium deserti]RAK52127.1 hypothetical protein DJ018_13305 [Phenylobacterium deserti]
MANTNIATGFKPVGARGGSYSGQINRYYVPASDATALFIGDPVVIAGDGDTTGVASVTRATAGTAGRVTGVVVGFDPDPTIRTNGYRAASTAAYVLVADDPDLICEVQEDAVGGALAAVDIGLNADMIAGSGSTATKLSGFQLDTSTKATTATLQLRILGFVQRADNEVGANAKVLVRFNTPTETGAAGSTGV